MNGRLVCRDYGWLLRTSVSTGGLSCATKESDVEQDHDFGGYGGSAFCRTGESFCAVMHRFGCAGSKDM